MVLTIYVDDSLIVGPDKLLIEEQEKILKRFKGKVIHPTIVRDSGDVWEVRDILGASHHYCRSKRKMKINMPIYIQKLLKKFGMEASKPVATPVVIGQGNLKEGKEVQFPLKSLIGGIQWVATICRPDVQHACQLVQRVTKVTNAAVVAGSRGL